MEFVNLIMQKEAPLIIFECIQLSGRTSSSRHHKAFLAKQNGKMTLLSAPGSIPIKTTLLKSLAEVLWCTQTVFLSKQAGTIEVAGKQRDTQTIEVLRAFTLLR